MKKSKQIYFSASLLFIAMQATAAVPENDSTVLSNANRNASSPQISQYQEAVHYSGSGSSPNLPANYHEGTALLTDDDGSYTADKSCTSNCSTVKSITAAEHNTMKDCGYPAAMQGSGLNAAVLTDRIRHCMIVNGALATWNGAENGINGEASWSLVARSVLTVNNQPVNKEVWQDQRTGLLWSSVDTYSVPPTNPPRNWCQSVGNNDANDSTCKANTNASFCSELMYPNKVAPTQGFYDDNYAAGTYSKSKGQLGLKSSPAVRWRVPTRADYMQADIDGIRFVMPDIGFDNTISEWTATTNGISGFTFQHPEGMYSTAPFWYFNPKQTVRCVGR